MKYDFFCHKIIFCLFKLETIKRFYLIGRFLLTPKQQDLFERIALYCDQFTNTNFIPVSFVLGTSDWTSSV